jgi:Na+/H+ antiporter NhaB
MLAGRPPPVRWPVRIARTAFWGAAWGTAGYYIKGANVGMPYWLCLLVTCVLVAGQEIFFAFGDRTASKQRPD